MRTVGYIHEEGAEQKKKRIGNGTGRNTDAAGAERRSRQKGREKGISNQ